jgi:CzcA family heavy metal efflux pump
LLGNTPENKTEKDPKVTAAMKRHYSIALQWCLRRPKIIIGSIALLFVVSLCLFFTLGRSFLPSFNEGSLTINVSTLPGISLEESDKIGKLAEQIILSEKEVQTVARKTGRAELDEHSLGVNVSEMEVPYKLSDRTRQEFVADLRKKLSVIPGASIEIGQPISHRIDAMLSGTRAQIAIKLFGNDLNQLYSTGQAIQRVVKSVDGVVDVNIEQQVERPQIEIIPRRDLLVRYGVPMNRFSEFVDVALAGKQVSQVYENGYPAALTVKFDGQEDQQIETLRQLPIDTPNGKVPLSYLADVNSVTGPNTINRENANRRIVISANVEGGDLRGTVNTISDRIDSEVELPQGYTIQYGGQFESEASASRTLAMTSVLSFIIIFLLLYLEFHDIHQSLIVLINMPLAMIGGVLILVISGSELNIPAIIGFISLLGIATRNGMLLISHYNQLRSEGCSLDQQISIGSVDRLTPIIMTALTSALAMIPLALRGTEPGNEIQSPMAMVILGGLFSSTALNMFVVPILYRWISRKKASAITPQNNITKDELLK